MNRSRELVSLVVNKNIKEINNRRYKIEKLKIVVMDYCRLCAKSAKPLIPILDDNPLKINEKIEKILRIQVRSC
jgi:hypothetical protein